MSFTGDEGDFISLTNASDLTANHRSDYPNDVQGHFLGKSKILDLLNQSGCKGLRIYHGVSGSTGAREIVVVGVNSNEDDILNSSNPLVLDGAIPCPPTCGTTNSLNS